MKRGGHGGLFSVSPPSVQRLWNGTIFLHILKQLHKQCGHSEGHFLCLSTKATPLGGSNRLGRLSGVKLKRDPHVLLQI